MLLEILEGVTERTSDTCEGVLCNPTLPAFMILESVKEIPKELHSSMYVTWMVLIEGMYIVKMHRFCHSLKVVDLLGK